MKPASEDQLWQLIASNREAVLATVRRDGSPHLTNILYTVDDPDRLVRISTLAGRAKTQHLGRNPRAALHVAGDDFWAWAVAEGRATLSEVATTAGDAACRELLIVHTAFYGPPAHEGDFYTEMIADRRLVIRLQVDRIYGLIATGGRRPITASS